jgi:hypothetical protein
VPLRNFLKRVGIIAALAFAPGSALAQAPANFLFLGSDELSASKALLARPDIQGAQIVYSWRQLEPEKGRYDFSAIEADLQLVEASGKKLFIQIQDRFFLPTARNVPDYILKDPEYRGGLVRQVDNPGEGKPEGSGWVTMQWHPPVRARFQALLKALGERFDGRVLGINLPESAADVGKPSGFTCDGYFDATSENILAAREAFKRSHVVQYVNFWPCEWNNDRKYMSRFFALAAEHRIGLGGPDIVPYRRGQMKNAYPFFNAYKGKLPIVAMAVQQPTLTYTNPETNKPFTKAEIVSFAQSYLGVDLIFWTAEAPWLRAIVRD